MSTSKTIALPGVGIFVLDKIEFVSEADEQGAFKIRMVSGELHRITAWDREKFLEILQKELRS